MAEAPAPTAARERLRQIIAEKSLITGRIFKLASGRESTYLIDMKKTMLDPEGIDLLADAFLENTLEIEAGHIGGLAMGAVPIGTRSSKYTVYSRAAVST